MAAKDENQQVVGDWSDRIPQLLSDRYHISLEEAQEIVNEARQHRWD